MYMTENEIQKKSNKSEISKYYFEGLTVFK